MGYMKIRPNTNFNTWIKHTISVPLVVKPPYESEIKKLQASANVLKNVIRSLDTMTRHGGGETP